MEKEKNSIRMSADQGMKIRWTWLENMEGNWPKTATRVYFSIPATDRYCFITTSPS